MKNKYLFMFAITVMLCAGLMAGLSAKVWAAPSVTVSVNGVLGSNDWYTSNPTFTVSATESSGIKTYEYVVTQSSIEPTSGWLTGSTGTITVESDTNYVWYRVTDNAGGVTIGSAGPYKLDKSVPSVGVYGTNAGWSNLNPGVTITASDNRSGLQSLEYQITSSSTQPTTGWMPYTEQISMPEGRVYLWYRATDYAGNVKTGYQLNHLDVTSPVLAVKQTRIAGTEVRIDVTATDGHSGVKSIRLPNNSVVTTTSATYTAPKAGTYTFIVTDNADNISRRDVVVTDITNPTVTPSSTDTSWRGSLTLALTYSDSESGIKTQEYQIQATRDPQPTNWLPYTGPLTLTDGYHYVWYRAVDNAGNENIGYFGSYRIDSTPPGVTIDDTNFEWRNTHPSVRITAVDALSGMKSLTYFVSTSTATPSQDPKYWSVAQPVTMPQGVNYLWYYAVDYVGNVTTNYVGPYRVDTVAPTATVTQTPLTGTQVKIDVVASDSGSGVESIKLPNGTVVNDSTASYVAPKTGIYPFVITDKAGNTTTTEVDVADMTPPTVTANNQGGAWVRSNFSVTLTWTDAESGVKTKEYAVTQDTTQPETGWLPYSSSISINTSGVYYIWYHAVDNADNSVYGYFGPYMLDKTAPTATSTLTPTTGISVQIDVTASDSHSGVKQIELPDTKKTIVPGNTATYVGQQGQSYNFVVTDNAGNPYTYLVKVPDTTPPTLSVDDKNYDWRNSSITTTIRADDKGAGVWTSEYQITQSTTEPSTGWTTFYDSKTITIDTDGENYLWYRVKDKEYNTTIGYYGPYRIDRVQPTVSHTLIKISDSEYRIDVTATDALSGIKYISPPTGGMVKEDHLSYTVTVGKNYNFSVYDNAGNRYILTVPVDMAPPEVSANNTDYSWQRGSISVSLSYTDDIGVVTREYQVTQSADQPNSSWLTWRGSAIPITTNGLNYIWYRALDAAGRESIGSFGPYRLDNTPPTVAVSQSNLADEQILIRVTASDVDSGVASIKLPDGTVVAGAEASFVATGVGNYVFVATDNVGNTKSYTHTIAGMDFTPPTVQADPASSNWSKEPLAVSLTYSDSQGSVVTKQYQVTDSTTPPTTSWLDYVGAVTLQGDRVNYLWYRAVDDSGNEAMGHFGPYRFDLLAPTASLTVNLTDEGVRVTVTGSDSGSGVASITLPDLTSVPSIVASYLFTSDNGRFEVIDAVGNRMVVTEAMIAVAVVEKLESMGKNLTYAQVTAAQKLVDAVADAAERAALQARLEVVRQSVPNPAEAASDAVDAAKDALNPATRYEDAVTAVQEAQNKIAQITDPAEKARLEQQLAPVIAVVNAEGTVRSAETATDALRQSETNLTPQSVADANAQVGAAKREAQALPASEKKDQLLERVREMEKAVQVADATLSVREAEQLVNSLPLTQASIDALTAKYNEASRKVKGLPEGEERTELQSRVDNIQISLLELIARVRLAEAEALIRTMSNIWVKIDDAQLALNKASQAVAKLSAGEVKTDLTVRVNDAQATINSARANIKVNIAEGLLIQGDINASWPYVNLLPAGAEKTNLTERLNLTQAVADAVVVVTKAETAYNAMVAALMANPLTTSANLAAVQGLYQTALIDACQATTEATSLIVTNQSPLSSRVADLKNRAANLNRMLPTVEKILAEAQDNIDFGNGYDVSRLRMILGGSANLKTSFDAAIKARLGSTDGLTWKTSDTSLVVLSASGSVTAVKTGVAKVTVSNKNGSMTIYLVITATR